MRKSQMPAYLQACGVGCEEVWGLAAAAAALRVGEKICGEGQRAVEQRWIYTLHGAGGNAVIRVYPLYHNAVRQTAQMHTNLHISLDEPTILAEKVGSLDHRWAQRLHSIPYMCVGSLYQDV